MRDAGSVIWAKYTGAISSDVPLTVVQALTLAGWLTETANQDEILIIRGGQDTVYKFNFSQFQKTENINQNMILTSGDQIIVK